jgi:hypothetical protein
VAWALAVALLVALGVFAVYTFGRSRLGRRAPGSETLQRTICDVKQGGEIRLGGFGDDGEDVLLKLTQVAKVRLGPDEWHELTAEYRGRGIRVEWRVRQGATRVVAYSRTDMPLSEVGLEAAALDAVRAGGPAMTLLGSSFKLEEIGDAIRGEALAFKTWLLHDEEKRRLVRIERVGEQSPKASIGKPIAADAIEVVRVG